MSRLNRLDRANFGGPLVQSPLFKEIRNPDDTYFDYEVSPAEEYDLYKISYNAYGTKEAWWVIAVAARLDNPMAKLPAGITVLKLPPLYKVREWMKEFTGKRIKR